MLALMEHYLLPQGYLGAGKAEEGGLTASEQRERVENKENGDGSEMLRNHVG